MELVLKDGDYLLDGNGALCAAAGHEAILQRALWRLTVRRGSFPFLPTLGSRLYLLPRERPGMRLSAAKQYVEEALAGEPGLTVGGVKLADGGAGSVELTVELEYEGERLSGMLTVQG